MLASALDIRDANIFKYYRVVRKWAARHYKLTEPELELLMTMNCVKRFTRNEFKNSEYLCSWDKHRWARLRREGWIDVWREGDNSYNRSWIYKTSRKCDEMIYRIYDILLGNKDIPSSVKNPYYKDDTYTKRVVNKVLDDMSKDEDRKVNKK